MELPGWLKEALGGKKEVFRTSIPQDLIDQIFDGRMDQETHLHSGRLLVIRQINSRGVEAGNLTCMFNIERGFQPGGALVEQDRIVKIGNVQVQKGNRKLGLAGKMIKEMEQYALRFGASHVEGDLVLKDRLSQHWLPDMYRKLGYEVVANHGEWKINKKLKQFENRQTE